MPPPRVFISYSHDSPAHAAAVLSFSDRLRQHGIDARLDRYEPWPTQGWPAWMRQQVGAADHVVCVCTATYRERFEGRAPPGEGLGASWEGWLAEHLVYRDRAQVGRFVPVLLGGRPEDVPEILCDQSRFDATRDFEGLLRRLSGQPEVVMPPLGPLPVLPPVAGGMEAPRDRDRVHAVLDLLEQALLRGAGREEITKLEERLRGAKGERGPDLQPGEVIGGRYLLLRRLGKGGFATVWAAWERLGASGRGRQVAMKVLHTHLHDHAEQVRRFEKGAHDLAALSDPDLVRVITPCHTLEGRHLFTMDLLPGENLQQAVLSGAVPAATALRHCLIVGRCLHRLHEKGIIHRDVKPSNILLDAEGRPKLSDFDLARNLNLSAMSDGRVTGDYLFTAPEQYKSAPVDRRVDVYGLAMTALWCVAQGALPEDFEIDREVGEVAVSPGVLAAILAGAERKVALRTVTVAAWCDAVEGAMAADEVTDPGQTPARRPASPPPRPATPSASPAPTPGPPAHPPATPSTPPRPEPQPTLSPSAGPAAAESPAPAEPPRLGHARRAGTRGLLGGAPRSAGARGAAGGTTADSGTDVVAPPRDSAPPARSVAPIGARAWGPGDVVCEPVGLPFVYIPGGTFQMGRRASPPAGSMEAAATWNDELPQHPVTLSPFAMSVTPVTQAQWRAVQAGLNLNPSHFKGKPDSDERPVEQVSWFDAVRWCNALSVLEGRRPVYVCDPFKLQEADGKTWEQWRDDAALRDRLADAVQLDREGTGYRLPTEAEWEYACRAGSETSFYSGEREADLARVGWYGNQGKPGGNSGGETHPVRQKLPNAWGLYDLHGNVWEWCGDWGIGTYPAEAVTDPTGPSRGGWRVVRGGSWWVDPGGCRSAYRVRGRPVYRSWNLGFRVVLPLSPPPR